MSKKRLITFGRQKVVMGDFTSYYEEVKLKLPTNQQILERL